MKILSVALAGAAAAASAFAAMEYKASKGNCLVQPDFVLILGCRVRGEEPEEILKTRIEAAASYMKSNIDCKAICCGGIVHKDQTKSEAQAIKEGLLAAGINEERIILEDKSTTTEENFINAKRIIEESGIKEPSLAILSSEFHLLRAEYIGRKKGIKATTIAAKTPKTKRLQAYIREFFCFPAALK
ncbi:MAG: YdcF family protein [Clostridia bacterium]|nr:YdcF family protein [Clostridia bacterium]